jgi:hypothetical protein
MRRFVPVSLLLVVMLLACSKSAKPTKTGFPEPAPDAANATYLIEGKMVTLSNGKADQPAAPGSASRSVTTLSAFAATGDLDGDGKLDLAAVLTNSPGGSGTFYYLAALMSSSSAPSPALLLGDRISVTQVALKSGIVTVSYSTRPDGAPFTATPSVPVSKTFRFSGGKLTPN